MWITIQQPAEPNAISVKMESPVHLKCWNKPVIMCGVKTQKTEVRKKEGGRWGVNQKDKINKAEVQTVRRKILHMCIGA
jgi:hypothetical protein